MMISINSIDCKNAMTKKHSIECAEENIQKKQKTRNSLLIQSLTTPKPTPYFIDKTYHEDINVNIIDTLLKSDVLRNKEENLMNVVGLSKVKEFNR